MIILLAIIGGYILLINLLGFIAGTPVKQAKPSYKNCLTMKEHLKKIKQQSKH